MPIFMLSHRRGLIALVAMAMFASATECSAQATESPVLASGQPVTRPTGDTIRLPAEEQEAILSTNTAETAAVARGERIDLRNVHGELGVMVGSNGARGIQGVAEIPLGDNAGAVVSFESTHFGRVRR